MKYIDENDLLKNEYQKMIRYHEKCSFIDCNLIAKNAIKILWWLCLWETIDLFRWKPARANSYLEQFRTRVSIKLMPSFIKLFFLMILYMGTSMICVLWGRRWCPVGVKIVPLPECQNITGFPLWILNLKMS